MRWRGLAKAPWRMSARWSEARGSLGVVLALSLALSLDGPWKATAVDDFR